MWRLLAIIASGSARLLPALSVVLGVGFLTGTLVLNDTLRQAAIDQFSLSATGIDVVVTPASESGTIPVGMLDDVRGTVGVAAADGRMWAPITVLGSDGESLTAARPGVLIGVPDSPELRDVNAVTGRLPAESGEVAVDRRSAEALGISLGQRIRLPQEGESQGAYSHDYRVSGLMELGASGDQFEGAFVVGLPTQAAVELVDAKRFARIDVLAQSGVPAAEVERTLAAGVGDGFRVQTGDEVRQEELEAALGGLNAFAYTLWAIAGVALTVAALVIINTFSVTMARRTREIALIRCVGATRRQVLAAGLIEAGLLGLSASAVGVGAGIAGAAVVIRWVSGSGDATDPAGTALRVELTAMLVALAAGCLVATLAVLRPVLRASRTAPVAALRRSIPNDLPDRRQVGIMVAAAVLGVSMLVTGPAIRQPGEDGWGALLVASVGWLLVVVTALLASPLYVPRLSALAGRAGRRVFGLPVELAGVNTIRAPRRTGVTAASVIIGLSLITLVSTVTTSYAQSVRHTITTSAPFAYELHATANGSIPASLATRLRDEATVDGTVGILSGGSMADAVVAGQTVRIRGVQASVGRLAPDAVVEGSLRSLGPGTVALQHDLADRLGAGVGDTVRLPTGSGGSGGEHRLVALLGSTSPFGPVALPAEDFQVLFPGAPTGTLLVSSAAGATAEETRQTVEEVLDDYPFVTAVSSEENLAQYTSGLATLRNLLSGLLVLAVLIAFLGIVNVLSLSIIERARESALLRALGLTRHGLRWMLSAESTLVTAVGTGVGILLGLAGGWAISSALPGEGAALVSVSAVQLAWFAAAAVLVGLLAGLLPGITAVHRPIASSLQED